MRAAFQPWGPVAFFAVLLAGCVGDTATSPAHDDASTPDSASCSSCVDASTDASSDAPVAFTPKALPGLALWLEGGTGLDTSASTVVKWHDQSGNKNDATPAKGSTGPVVGTLLSKPALQFNQDSSIEMLDSTSLQWGIGDFLLEIVAAYANPIPDAGFAYGEFYWKQTQSGAFPGIVLVGNSQLDRTGKVGIGLDSNTFIYSTGSNLNDGTPRLIAARRKGTTLEIRLGGAVVGTITNAGVGLDVSAVGSGVRIGGLLGSTTLKGAIAEVIAVKGPTSDGDLAALEGYAIKKYGL